MTAKCCLIIFAREPELGKVKTRLAKDLSPERALSFYRAFVLDTLAAARRSSADVTVMAYASDRPASWLRKSARGCVFHRQKGADLGGRILNAVRSCRKRYPGFLPVVIGTDMPHLPTSVINQAFRTLKKHDLVLGPCEDGGFYLIGMKRFFSGIFQEVAWSSRKVLAQTRHNAETVGFQTALLEKGYDIDTLADLTRLQKDLLKKKVKAKETETLLNLKTRS